MKPFVFHLLGLSHLPASKEYSSCAFTAKNIKMARMLCSLGHIVHMYGAKTTNKNIFDIDKYVNSKNFYFVETHTVNDIRKDFGEGNNLYEIGYAWPNGEYKHTLNVVPAEQNAVTKKFYANAIEHINKIKKSDDYLLVTQGNFHLPIADAVGLFLTLESSIGYRGSNPKWFRSFESAFGMNFATGSEHPFQSVNGSNYNCVIPNWFDKEDVEFSEKKEDYFLFMARLIKRKGILEAYSACRETNKKLIIAGQCGVLKPDGHLGSVYQGEFDIPPGNWEYVGFKGIDERKKLMARAEGFFCNTVYLEQFGGTHIEAMLSGTPIITSNWGVFGDGNTFTPGIHGFRASTLDDYVFAVSNCKKLDPHVIRKNGERFLTENIRWLYQKWFEDLYFLYESTLDKNAKGWHRVRKEIPRFRKELYPHLFKE
jgi:glycosyltransferase involved in cell wall biosynthesis